MRVLIGCGGTGGHIYPALAIAQALHILGVSVWFVGAQGGMEMDLVAAAGYRIEAVPIRGWQRKKIFVNIRLPFLLLKSLCHVKKIIEQFKPDLVMGTGGYAAFPTLLAACSKRIPTLIQEQNSVSGLANKLLSRWVTKICIAYPTVSFSKAAHKVVLTGNPVRPSIGAISQGDRIEAFHYFNLDIRKKCLLVMGGSGGAGQLNLTILKNLATLASLSIQLLWITGRRYFEAMAAYLSNHGNQGMVRCCAFIDRMEMAYLASDVIIARAGALSIAELCVAKKPTILVPSPHVVGDHQTKNSLPLVEQGAALLVADDQCPKLLLPQAVALLQDVTRQRALVQRMDVFASLHGNALNHIVREIVKLIAGERGNPPFPQ